MVQLVKDIDVPVETIWNIRAPSIRIPVRIIYNEKQIDARALLDSGAEGLYCNTKFIQKHQLPLRTLDNPVHTRNVDGSPNKHGTIHHAAILRMEMGDNH